MPHLTLAQVFSALTYYSDHPAEINRYIEQNRIPDELIDPLVKSIFTDASQVCSKGRLIVVEDNNIPLNQQIHKRQTI